MNTSTSPKSPLATWAGLAIALVATPMVAAVFRQVVGETPSDLQLVARELVLFAMVAGLLCIVQRGEKQPLTSIGLRVDHPGKSVAWGLLLAVIALVITVGLYLLLPMVGLSFGSSDGHASRPSLWVVTLVMLRAGVLEEVFYRGYAIERLERFTRHRWIAVVIPLAAFGAAHYRQGAGGIVAAVVLGGLFTIAYLKRRDLVTNITGHFLVDLVLNVGLPLLGGD
jgi:membrane protease YdiL (CAAX protease family)